MIEFELTPEQRVKMAAVINSLVEEPIRATLDCGMTFADETEGDSVVLRIISVPTVFSLTLTDEQLGSMLSQAFDSLKSRVERIQEIADSLVDITPEES